MTIQHKSLRDEILFVIGRATAPLNSSEIYERCTLADEMKQVSNAIFQLKDLGKIAAAEGDGRKRYTLAPGVSAPAPEGKAGRPPEASAAPAEPAAAAAPVTGTSVGRSPIRPAPEPGLPVLDIPKPAEAAPPACPGPVAGLFDERVEDLAAGSNAERLADAIIARLKRELAPTMCELEASAGLDRLNVHIHIEQVDFHLGGL